MTHQNGGARWPMLNAPNWKSAFQARAWLLEQRKLLDWSHKDVSKAFDDCAGQSDLYIGSGGGALFDRPTEKRIARFEQEGQDIPDWMFWMPLTFDRAKVVADLWEWDRKNIPEHSEVRKETEEADYYAHQYELDDDEIEIISRFRSMTAEERIVIRFFAEPKMLRWLTESMTRADQAGTTLPEIVDKALG